MTGFIMKDKALFQQTGLLPADLPPFCTAIRGTTAFGFTSNPASTIAATAAARGDARFHEHHPGRVRPAVVHGRHRRVAGNPPPPGGPPQLGAMPANRQEVPEWGRIRIIKEAFAEHRAMRVAGVVGYPPIVYLDNVPYAWSWALAALLDGNPQYRDRFRQLYNAIPQGRVNVRFYELFQSDWQELNEQWQVFIAEIEYGYDFARTADRFHPGWAVAVGRGQGESRRRPRLAEQRPVAAIRQAISPYGLGPLPGGQNHAGLVVRAGRRLDPLLPGPPAGHPPCRRPAGTIAAVARRQEPVHTAGPLVVGLGTTLSPPQSGTLF